MEMGGGWVCEADIEGFYEALNRGHLRSFLGHRVRDGVIRRTIDKWLKAGVMEKGSVFHPETGTPQGGVISPLLSNIYLHEVLDKWFVTEVLPLLKGRGVLIRYADDFVLVFECESDARRVMTVLAKRFAKYGLRLHPEKTRRFCFKRPWGPPEPGRKDRGARSFEFLGFTHYWGKSRRGYWVIKRKSASSRVSRFLRGVSQWCRRHRHKPVGWQHGRLVSKLRGHYGYFAVRGNSKTLNGVRNQVERAWRKWLNRRSHKSRMSWQRFGPLLERYPLPKPRILHAI